MVSLPTSSTLPLNSDLVKCQRNVLLVDYHSFILDKNYSGYYTVKVAITISKPALNVFNRPIPCLYCSTDGSQSSSRHLTSPLIKYDPVGKSFTPNSRQVPFKFKYCVELNVLLEFLQKFELSEFSLSNELVYLGNKKSKLPDLDNAVIQSFQSQSFSLSELEGFQSKYYKDREIQLSSGVSEEDSDLMNVVNTRIVADFFLLSTHFCPIYEFQLVWQGYRSLLNDNQSASDIVDNLKVILEGLVQFRKFDVSNQPLESFWNWIPQIFNIFFYIGSIQFKPVAEPLLTLLASVLGDSTLIDFVLNEFLLFANCPLFKLIQTDFPDLFHLISDSKLPTSPSHLYSLHFSNFLARFLEMNSCRFSKFSSRQCQLAIVVINRILPILTAHDHSLSIELIQFFEHISSFVPHCIVISNSESKNIVNLILELNFFLILFLVESPTIWSILPDCYFLLPKLVSPFLDCMSLESFNIKEVFEYLLKFFTKLKDIQFSSINSAYQQFILTKFVPQIFTQISTLEHLQTVSSKSLLSKLILAMIDVVEINMQLFTSSISNYLMNILQFVYIPHSFFLDNVKDFYLSTRDYCFTTSDDVDVSTVLDATCQFQLKHVSIINKILSLSAKFQKEFGFKPSFCPNDSSAFLCDYVLFLIQKLLKSEIDHFHLLLSSFLSFIICNISHLSITRPSFCPVSPLSSKLFDVASQNPHSIILYSSLSLFAKISLKKSAILNPQLLSSFSFLFPVLVSVTPPLSVCTCYHESSFISELLFRNIFHYLSQPEVPLDDVSFCKDLLVDLIFHLSFSKGHTTTESLANLEKKLPFWCFDLLLKVFTDLSYDQISQLSLNLSIIQSGIDHDIFPVTFSKESKPSFQIFQIFVQIVSIHPKRLSSNFWSFTFLLKSCWNVQSTAKDLKLLVECLVHFGWIREAVFALESFLLSWSFDLEAFDQLIDLYQSSNQITRAQKFLVNFKSRLNDNVPPQVGQTLDLFHSKNSSEKDLHPFIIGISMSQNSMEAVFGTSCSCTLVFLKYWSESCVEDDRALRSMIESDFPIFETVPFEILNSVEIQNIAFKLGEPSRIEFNETEVLVVGFPFPVCLLCKIFS
ncbi:hypothetical protein GEMRC1_008017 [Eukaryota sp. GEM-RC1]